MTDLPAAECGEIMADSRRRFGAPRCHFAEDLAATAGIDLHPATPAGGACQNLGKSVANLRGGPLFAAWQQSYRLRRNVMPFRRIFEEIIEITSTIYQLRPGLARQSRQNPDRNVARSRQVCVILLCPSARPG